MSAVSPSFTPDLSPANSSCILLFPSQNYHLLYGLPVALHPRTGPCGISPIHIGIQIGVIVQLLFR